MKKYHFISILLCVITISTVYFQSQHAGDGVDYVELMYNDKPENPKERLEWRAAQKGGSYDPEIAMKAGKRSKKLMDLALKKPTLKDGGLRSWISLGPGDTGGRIRSIAIHPNNPSIIFIGSVAGGIWRSFNGGSTWSMVDDFMPNLAITQIVFNPTNPNIMYASTGEGFGGGGIASDSDSPGVMNRGLGVLKSIDGGFNWFETDFPDSRFFWVNDIAIDNNNPEHLYAITMDGGLYKTTNGGSQWNLITSGLGNLTDIKIDPSNSNNVLVGSRGNIGRDAMGNLTFTGGSLYRSANATSSISTINFTEITDGTNQIGPSGRIEIAYAPSNSNIIYASVHSGTGQVWRSTDGGVTWNLQSPASLNHLGNQGWYDNTIWVDPLNSNNIIIGGIGLFRSTNGGVSFTDITGIHVDQHAIVEAGNYSSSNRKVFIGNDGGIFSTDNFLTATNTTGWNNLNQNIRITQFYGGSVSKDLSFVIGGSQDNGVNIDRQFGGNNWDIPIGGDGAFAAVNYNDKNIAYANSNNNRIWKTVDNGQNWSTIAYFNRVDNNCATNLTTGCSNSTQFWVADGSTLISKFIMDPNDPDIIYACSNRLWMNNSAGAPGSWSVIRSASGGQVSAMDVGATSNKLWIGTADGNVEISTNTGSSWTDVGASIPDNFITDIAVNPSNDNQVMVTVGGYSTDNIWYTPDGGSTWNNRSLDFDMQVNTITWHPTVPGWVYIGTDFGIYASEDYGQNWSITPVFDENEGPFYAEVSELFWGGDGSFVFPHYLYAASFARGMWRTGTPVREGLYVDKNWNGFQTGSAAQPYRTFRQAVFNAAHGQTIYFLSTGDHDEVPVEILLEKRIKVELVNGGVPIVIK